MREATSESPGRLTYPAHRTSPEKCVDNTAFLHGGPPPAAVNDEFSRRIKQAERAYRGERAKEYRLGLSAAVALCTLNQEHTAPYRERSPKFAAYELGWEDGMLAWLKIHPDAFYLPGSALPGGAGLGAVRR